jgi:L-rhamnonate dehydratase
MKIDRIIAAPLRDRSRLGRATSPRAKSELIVDGGNTLARHREFTGRGNYHDMPWSDTVCIAIAEDGTWGMGMTGHAGPVVPIINHFLAPLITGENVMATERTWDMMFNHASLFGVGGLTSYAISAVDLALWDLKGKLLGVPVYELMGGPARDKVHCYATGVNFEWMLECGFEAIKVTCPYGEALGNVSLDRAEDLIGQARAAIGDERELMLDCWSVGSVEFMVRLAERLRPYNLKWLEDFLYPEDYDGFEEMRRRVPWQTLATGERWVTHLPFMEAAAKRSVDIFQPDIRWVGGVTAVQKIGHIAEGAGLQVALHGGMNDAFGQHACHAMMSNTWGEFLVDSAPGVPLEEGWRPTPGMAVPVNGSLIPSDAPGFGIELTRDELEAMTG